MALPPAALLPGLLKDYAAEVSRRSKAVRYLLPRSAPDHRRPRLQRVPMVLQLLWSDPQQTLHLRLLSQHLRACVPPLSQLLSLCAVTPPPPPMTQPTL